MRVVLACCIALGMAFISYDLFFRRKRERVPVRARKHLSEAPGPFGKFVRDRWPNGILRNNGSGNDRNPQNA